MILKHEDYEFKRNDIALITLERDVVFNDKIQPACLPPKDFSYPDKENEMSYMAGWGRTVEDDPHSRSDLLQDVEAVIETSTHCQLFEKSFTSDSKVCLGKYAKLFFSLNHFKQCFLF